VQPLVDTNWLAVRVLVERSEIHSILDGLEEVGCVAILESEVRQTRL
jgi:ATP phosphoribosyltransferase